MAQQDYVYAQLGQKAVKNEYNGGVTDSATVYVNNEDNTIYVYSHATVDNIRQVVLDVISEELHVSDTEVQHQFVYKVDEVNGKVVISRRGLVKGDLPALGIEDITGLAIALANKLDASMVVDNLNSDDATKVLSAKQGKVLNESKQATLVSGTNIKTLNGQSLLGSGDISAQAAWGNIIGTLSNQTDLNTALSGKQETLVSGTNIKTINSETLLGNGNIDIQVNDGAVKFLTDIKTNYSIGKYNGTIANAVTIPAANKTIKQVWDDIFIVVVPPTVVQPKITGGITNNDISFEAGYPVTPTYSFGLDPGSYSFGPTTDVVANSWTVTDTKGVSKDTNTGSFDQFTIVDNEVYSMTATAVHSQGAIPLNNQGTGVPESRIAAGSKTGASSVNLTSFRKIFYGYSNVVSPTSSDIRNLINNKANSPLVNVLLSESRLSKTIIIAAPTGTRTLTSVTMPSSSEADVTSQFIKQPNTLMVQGYGGYNAVAYDVWIYNPATMAGTYRINMA